MYEFHPNFTPPAATTRGAPAHKTSHKHKMEPPRICFAQAHERCRAAGGTSSCARWHAVSAHESFCQDCVDFYGRGEGWHLWKVTDTPYFFRRNRDLGTISV